jgi:hypothetical protein
MDIQSFGGSTRMVAWNSCMAAAGGGDAVGRQ